MPYTQFDRSRLSLRPLAERAHDYVVADMLSLDEVASDFRDSALPVLADRLLAAREGGHARILMMGAHPIKYGLSRHIIDLMERGVFSAVAFNGACAIHDYELARVGATSESVARYIRTGQFGLWQETGELNEIAKSAAERGIGFGEVIGEAIWAGNLPNCDVSVLAAGYRLGIPVTVHVSLGYDIVHMHPNCDGAALGAASYADFLTYAHQVQGLEGGVMISIGTAIMGPEVYLKALSMVRNVASQEGKQICHFTTAVFDIQDLGQDPGSEPSRDEPRYYFRPLKTILVRTVSDGGESYYVRGDHRQTIPALRRHIIASEGQV